MGFRDNFTWYPGQLEDKILKQSITSTEPGQHSITYNFTGLSEGAKRKENKEAKKEGKEREREVCNKNI